MTAAIVVTGSAVFVVGWFAWSLCRAADKPYPPHPLTRVEDWFEADTSTHAIAPPSPLRATRGRVEHTGQRYCRDCCCALRVGGKRRCVIKNRSVKHGSQACREYTE